MRVAIVLPLFVLGTCGRSPAPKEQLVEPPAVGEETVTLRSRFYCGAGAEASDAAMSSYDVVIELLPSGRWRYAWRDGQSTGAWNELQGAWKRTEVLPTGWRWKLRGDWNKLRRHLKGVKGNSWYLIPDDPGKALDSTFATGQFPLLSWGRTVAFSGKSPQAAIRSGKVRKGACCYIVPLVDPDTGRFSKYVTIAPDPRGG